MATILEEAMSLLELIEHPTTIDILKVQAKVKKKLPDQKVSERQIWRALKRLREKSQKESEEYDLLTDMKSDIEFFLHLLLELGKHQRKLNATELKRVNAIEEKIKSIDAKILELRRTA